MAGTEKLGEEGVDTCKVASDERPNTLVTLDNLDNLDADGQLPANVRAQMEAYLTSLT